MTQPNEIWTGDGPLPTPALEEAARELFADTHPVQLWSEPSMRYESNGARRQILRAYLWFIMASRWTLGTMTDRLEEGLSQIVFGDRGPSPAESDRLHQYAESCIHGLFEQFMGDQRGKAAVAQQLWSIPKGHGIDERWQQAYVAVKFAEVLTELACPGVPFVKMDVSDRTWLRGQTEQLVEDVIDRFTEHPGDPEYRPEDEPEYHDDIDFNGRPESEK